MPILAVYQQSFIASQATTYDWSWQLRRVFKSKQSSQFVVKITNNGILSTSTVTTPIVLYLSSPELCGGVDTVVQNTAGNTVKQNKFPIVTYIGSNLNAANNNNQAVFVCNEFPSNPILINAEFSGTQAAPSGNFFFSLGLTIYEIDYGDIPSDIL